MNFKKASLLLLVLILVTGLAVVSTRDVQAQDAGCDLLRPGMTLSADCDEIFFVWGWAAMTPGQVNEFLKGTRDTLTLRDEVGNLLKVISPRDIAITWSEAYPIDPADLGVQCGMPKAWETDSVVSLGSLRPGKYTLTIERTFLHPVTDGFNACWMEGFKLPVSLYFGSGSITADFEIE
ncbi:MAG: hypothetical protein ACM3PS_08025 [Syntrophothermus sp.]